MGVTHAFTSAVADGSDSSLVRPSDWNSAHSVEAWDDLREEPTIRSTGTFVPAFEQYFTNGAGSRGVYLYSFDDALVGAQKEVYMTFQMPHEWDGTDIYPHVHFVPAATVNSSAVRWGLEYTWTDIGQLFADTQLSYVSTTSSGDANITAKKHYLAAFDPITPSATQDGLSSILICRLWRDSAHADDTYTNKVGLLYFDIHYRKDSVGSNAQFTK